MDGFERVLALLRRGRVEQAERLRAEEPGAWLPAWTAGEPLSLALRQVHRLGSQVTAVRVDDVFAWAFAGGEVFRISPADGTVHRVSLEGQEEFVSSGVFIGDRMVGIEDERLLVWDITTGRLLVATDPDDVPRRAGGLSSVAVGAGVAVTGTAGGYLLQWSLADGRLLARSAAHGGYVGTVAIDTAGTPMVLSLGGENRYTGTLCFHELDGLRRTGEVPLPPDTGCGGWTTLDSQRRAVIIGYEGLLTVWDPAAVVPVAQFPTTARGLQTPAFTATGSRVVLKESKALRIVDLHDGAVHATIRSDFTFDIGLVAVHGRFVFAAQFGSSEGRTNLLELTDPLPQDAPVRPRFLDATPATIDGRPVVVAVDEDGPYLVYDTTDGRELRLAGERSNIHKFLGGTPHLRTVTVAGRDLVLSMSNRLLTVIDPSTGEIRTAPPSPTVQPVLVAVAAGEGLAATVDAAGTLAIWDVATQTQRATTHVPATSRTTSVTLGNLHGRTIVLTGTDNGMIHWFDGIDLTSVPPPGQHPTHTNPTSPAPVTALDITATMLTTAADSTVTCVDLATGQPYGPPLTHPGTITAILPGTLDGQPTVATSCTDRTLRIWNITTGQPILAIPHPRPIHRILSATTTELVILDNGYLTAITPTHRTR